MSRLKVMSVMAHQDDFEFEAAGLFLKLRGYYGSDVELKILTTSRGSSGHYAYDTETTANIREMEARRSAEIIGAKYENLTQLDGSHVHAQVFCDRNMLGGLWNAIRAFAPDYLISPPVSINPLAGIHIDHQHTAEAVRLVAYQLGVPNAYPTMNGERRLRYKPPVILNCIDGYVREPVWHFRINVNDVKMQKIQMLQCHKSQLEEWLPFINSLDKEDNSKWSKEDWLNQTEKRHVSRNKLCGFDETLWYEYFAITEWGAGSWSNNDFPKKLRDDFPFLSLK